MKDHKANYYDRNGDEITVFELNAKIEDPKYKFVKKDVINGYLVSTVWTGINMNYTKKGKPIIFETMVFKENWLNNAFGYQERYETEEEAKKGHEIAVLFVKANTKKVKG